MTEDLTTRQMQVLACIRDSVSTRGYPPSVREICETVGLSSPSTVHSHLNSLVQAGYLRRDPSKPRALEVVDPHEPALPRSRSRDVPLVGRIAAGSPIIAEQDIEDVFAMPEAIVGDGPVYMLAVRGDSMVDAGILDGDYVAVRSQDDARSGDIVAALVGDEEATVKTLRRNGSTITLEPANKAYEPMVFTEGVQILGKVVAVLRSV